MMTSRNIQEIPLKKVLFVTHHFPPSGGSKTRRTLQFLKYLPRLAWHPVVLTAKGAKVFNFDPSLLEEVPKDINIYRATNISSFFQKSSPHAPSEYSKKSSSHILTKSPLKRFKKNLVNFLKEWIIIPDEFILWLPCAVLEGLNIVRNERINVIYSTAPPFSNHIIAVILKRLLNIALVIDFRDAWVSNPARKFQDTKGRRIIESFLEKIVIRNSDVIISTTHGITQDFRARYPLEPATKFVTITNGYDREELETAEINKNFIPNKMRIVHTGYLSKERSPKSFLKALRLLFDEKPALENEIEVYFIGENNEFIDEMKIEDYIRKYSLSTVVKVTGHIPRTESMYYQMSADILLLIIGIIPKDKIFTYGIASKVFDYMLAKRPILSISDIGPVSEIIEETKIGEVFDPYDIKGIKQYILKYFNFYKRNEICIQANQQEIAKYDVKILTKKLASLLDCCIKKN
jgi:glycosyltransferase involved in cell wall biosynthesis